MSLLHRLGHLGLILIASLAIALVGIMPAMALNAADPSSTVATGSAPAAESSPAPSEPTQEPSAEPTQAPTEEPSAAPTPEPTPALTPPAAVTDEPSPTEVAPLASVQSLVPTADAGTACENTGGKVDTFMQKSDQTDWANGNLAIGLFEGGYVHQRIEMSGVPTTGTNQLVFTYAVKDGAYWAYDYVANQHMDNGTITGWTVADEDGPTATVTVSFTATTGSPTLYFDAHIASELDHGPGTGAGSISGSPYHVSLRLLNCATTGNMDNQIKTGAVQAGNVTLVKSADPSDGTDFNFSINAPTVGSVNVTLDDDNDTDSTHADRVTYRVAPGAVTVAEQDIPAGWQLSGLVCTGVTATNSGTGASFTLVDKADVVCTFTDTKQQFKDLSVSKTATPSFSRDYDWSVKKTVDRSSANVADGSKALFNYSVTATPTTAQDSDFKVSGVITVDNDNDVAISGVNVTDAIGATTCTVTGGGAATIPANDQSTFAYTCTMPAGTTASTTGMNIAKAAWNKGDYYGTTGTASGQKDFSFANVVPTTSGQLATVTDDHFDLNTLPGGNIVDAVADAQGKTFSYSKEYAGTAGTCSKMDNEATLTASDGQTDTSSQAVTVCVGADLVVSKNVVSSFDRTYDWDILKTVKGHADTDTPTVNVDPATGKATVDYTVTVTEGAYTDSNWVMSGSITVTNPNDWEDISATVTDSVNVGGGALCTVAGGDNVVIPKGGAPVTLAYSCTFSSEPDYDGINTATASWDKATHFTPGSSAQGTATVASDGWSVTPINETVTVTDDQAGTAAPKELGSATWTAEGTTHTYDVSLTLDGIKGECKDYTNIASLSPTNQSNDAAVKVCWPVDLTVEKSVDATFERTYDWDISKVVDKTKRTVDAATGKATFDYTVAATPDGFADSNPAVTGTITVTNPNTFKDVTVDIADTITLDGVSCDIAGGGQDVVVPKDGQTQVDYTCKNFGAITDPVATTGTNTATVTWSDGSASDDAPVAFRLGKSTHETVTVSDPMADPDTLGQAVWNAADVATEFRYSVEHQGVAGECRTFPNTAVIVGTDQEASADATLCVQKSPSVTKTATPKFDRDYDWTIEKGLADGQSDEQTIASGAASFDYEVTATPSAQDSNFRVEGTITLTNGNDWALTKVDLSDGLPAATCVFGADATDLTIPARTAGVDGSLSVPYGCDLTDGTTTSTGVNSATATWPAIDGTQVAGSQDGTASFDFTGVDPSAVTDQSATVTDDHFDLSTLPGGNVVNAVTDPQGKTFAYSVTWPGVVGECTDYENVATVTVNAQPLAGLMAVPSGAGSVGVLAAGDSDSDSQTVTVCKQAALTVDKTADASFDRTYHWQIDKSLVDGDGQVEIQSSGSATVNYAVTATPDGYTDDDKTLSGTITVSNPNSFGTSISGTVTDVVNIAGVVCTVDDGGAVSVPAAVGSEPGTVDVDYTCAVGSVAEADYTGHTNTATVAWTDADNTAQTASSDPVPVTFVLDNETNKTVNVFDDKTQPESVAPVLIGTADWNSDGTPVTVATYSLTLTGVEGQCTDYTNTAFVDLNDDGVGGADDPTDSATVQVCVEQALTIVKTAAGSLDRDYLWNIAKTVDRTKATVDGGKDADFKYTVTASADGHTDSNWNVDGSFTVHNANAYKDVDITISDVPAMGDGVTCQLDDGQSLSVKAGETNTIGYSCAFEQQPDYDGTNGAVLEWTDRNDVTQSVEADPVPVTWALSKETNKSIDVYDNMVSLDGIGEQLGTARWDDGNTAFPYTLSQTATAGACVDYTNTAMLMPQVGPTVGIAPLSSTLVPGDATQPQSASATVTLCGNTPTVPVATPVVPQTGAPAHMTALLGLGVVALLLGAGLLLASRRQGRHAGGHRS